MNYVLAVAALVGAGASVASIALLIRQLRLSRELTQRTSEYNFLDSSKSRVLELDADRALTRLGVGPIALRLETPLTHEEVDSAADDPDAHYAINYLLNELENLCVAREFGLVSAPVFQRVHAARIRWWSRFLRHYIELMRGRLTDGGLWQGVYSSGTDAETNLRSQ